MNVRTKYSLQKIYIKHGIFGKLEVWIWDHYQVTDNVNISQVLESILKIDELVGIRRSEMYSSMCPKSDL